MKYAREFVISAVVGGLLILLPLYLAALMLLKGMQSIRALVRPLAALLPEWLPGEDLLALLALLIACFIVGAMVRTRAGRTSRERLERLFFGRLPGYATFRGMTQRLTGGGEENVWKPALAEIEDALVPAFIVEELDDGRCVVLVPSVPTPAAGSLFILKRDRVHWVDAPVTEAIAVITRWGAGTSKLVNAMR